MRHIQLEEYERRPLGEKIAEYEQFGADPCNSRQRLGMLDLISLHGEEAVVAMIDRLEHPRPQFPRKDAMTVLSFVHSGGFDLRGHPAMDAIRKVARDAPDEETRRAALETIDKINAYDPAARRR